MFRKFYACMHMFVCVSESESKGWDQASVSVLWVHFKDVCVWVCSAPRHMCMSYSFSTAYWPLTLTAIARPCYNCPFEPPVASVAPKGGSLRACVCVCVCCWARRPVMAVWSWAELTGLEEPGLRGEESLPSLSPGDQKWHSASADALRAADD